MDPGLSSGDGFRIKGFWLLSPSLKRKSTIRVCLIPGQLTLPLFFETHVVMGENPITPRAELYVYYDLIRCFGILESLKPYKLQTLKH